MTYEQIQQLISNRHSSYPAQLSGERISTEKIQNLLELAKWAPTHRKTEPWRFQVFSGKSLLQLLGAKKEWLKTQNLAEDMLQKKVSKFDQMAKQVSHILSISVAFDEMKRVPQWEEIAATAAAVQNMYLGMDSLEIAGYWSTGNTDSNESRNYLNLSDHERHLGWLFLGEKQKDLPSPRRIRKPTSEYTIWHV